MSQAHAFSCPSLSSFAKMGLLAVLASAAGPSPAEAACAFSNAKTPARGVPSALWGELQPTDLGQLPAGRDNTGFDQVGDFERFPYFEALDAEGGYVFVAASRRLQIWDARSNPGNPSSVFDLGFRSMGLTWNADSHAFFIFEDLDAPTGSSNSLALVGRYGLGVAIYDTSNKVSPELVYQDHGDNGTGGRWAGAVYAGRIGGQDYAFVASDQGVSGVYAYNMSAAVQLSAPCIEFQPGGTQCPGVFVRKIGSRTKATAIDGVGNFIAIASGVAPKGVDVWDVSNPGSPVQVITGLTSDSVYSVAMWQEGASYFLAVRTQSDARIYNVSCIANGPCSLGSPVFSRSMPGSAAGTVTFSRSGSTPFLYLGLEDECLTGNQNEWLYDVSNASNPTDISPQGTVVINGAPVSYWGHYYWDNGVHGFNRVAPRMGKFQGDYFYRAGHSIFDIHERTGGSPPVADFSWTPALVYPGTSVSFTDTSSGSPTSWDWDFLPNGVPSSSTQRNPSGVTFPTAGNKTITLQASNLSGSDTETKTLTVLPPEPNVPSVTVSPNPALLCQPVTFSAQNVTGQPPLTFSWVVRDSGNVTVASGGNVNPFVWTTIPSLSPGTYTAEVSVANTSGIDTATSPVLTLNALPALPAAGSFTPTYPGAPNPPPTGTVTFSVVATGATEWNWNFGDNPGGGPQGDGYVGWTSDPVNGPSPTHSYTSAGTFGVRVKVRNCVESERESAPLSVPITNVTPLNAHFQASGLLCQQGVCFATVNEAITFNDSSTGPPDFWDYDWDGNGSYEDANNTSPETTHTYTATGDYQPKLRVRRGSEQHVYTHSPPIRVESGGGGGGGGGNNPVISVAGPTSGTVNQNLVYSATAANCTPAPSGWNWTTSEGTINGPADTSTINVAWATAGNKIVRASNSACGTASGSRSVAISGGGGGGGGALNATFSFTPPNPVTGQTISFDGSSSTGSPTAHSWTFGDGATGSGATVTHAYGAPGTYSVTLEVSKQDTSCSFGVCTDRETKTVVVQPSGPQPLDARFTVNAPCLGTAGQEICEAQAGQAFQFSDVTSGDVTSRSWSFGDGSAAETAKNVTHSFNRAGTFIVRLTVNRGQEQDTAQKTFNVSAPPLADLVVLPWAVQSEGAVDQVSALYLHNPDGVARTITLRFQERRAADDTRQAPEVEVTLGPGATGYFPDVLNDLFGLENVVGFFEIQVEGQGATQPTAVSYHRYVLQDGETFGQAVPAVPLAQFPGVTSGGETGFHLMGLNDNAESLAFFGITNPNDEPARFRLRFFDRSGEEIGPDEEVVLSVSPHNQRQFQPAIIRENFLIEDQVDYRVDLEVLTGSPIFPYGTNVRVPALDPSFLQPADPTAEKVYLLGVLATQGLDGSFWQTDALMANPTSATLQTTITFTGLGVDAEPLSPAVLTLQPGETKRVDNVLVNIFDLPQADSVGFLTFESSASGGVHPLVQAESYNTIDGDRFGQLVPSFTSAQVAKAGEIQILTGLQQDEDFRSTIWLFNPSADVTGTYTLIYLSLDGQELGRFDRKVPPGRLRQLLPRDHALPDADIGDGFTVRIEVLRGELISAAQVVNNKNNDPAFVIGQTR